MKFSQILTASLFAASTVLALPQGENVQRDVEARATCPEQRRAVPWYRAYNPQAVDHFYTTDQAEFNNAVSNLGYNDEGIAALIFNQPQRGTVAFYRDFNSQRIDHFYTTDLQESNNAIQNDGYTSEGITGWIYPDSSCRGTVPLYRLFNPTGFDHFYTTNANERNSAVQDGYNDEGIAGYVIPFRVQ
ncbi:hypothetical protein DXG03_008678 [Asterophora parasitica]|uniref:DUF5648 domain-containing protein n=1 Tax=Asterophora parasitica TaxID=117018 RepID=A0A9P7GBN0_9AGAR|nr:hypothetical protein DXG03_008678 [Asterophora parasitica]